MKTLLILLTSLILSANELYLEVLGSGGPELDGRASASYLLWIDGKARVLIDSGSGSMLRFEESGAKLEDLEAILITHLHIDHVVDLPAYIKAGYFSSRSQLLPIVGPYGNHAFPGIKEYLTLQFGSKGSYRYMQDVLTPQSDSFQIEGIQMNAKQTKKLVFEHFNLEVHNVYHGIIPALAFKITVGDKTVLISGDTSNQAGGLDALAKNIDLFVAHHAVSQMANHYASQLHMKPSTIGEIAKDSGAKTLLLTHRMRRTIGKEEASLKIIRKAYKGKVIFAEEHTKIAF